MFERFVSQVQDDRVAALSLHALAAPGALRRKRILKLTFHQQAALLPGWPGVGAAREAGEAPGQLKASRRTAGGNRLPANKTTT